MSPRSPAALFAAATCVLILSGCAEKAAEPAKSAPAAAAEAAAPAADEATAASDTPAELPGLPIALRAAGNEPGWRIDMSATELVLTTLDGETRAGAPAIDTTFTDGGVRYVAAGEKGQIAVKVVDQLCVDSMSGMPYPQQVRVRVDERELSGCGGDPASLLQGPEWSVAEIGGAAIVKDSAVSLNFGTDGTLSGGSSCNRFMSAYTLTGESLSITQGAGSMMMCEEPLMAQEGKFLALLATVNRFEIAPDGALHLKAADGQSIRATR
jgi:heat shock protein HslJ